jgi:O-antigen ligase
MELIIVFSIFLMPYAAIGEGSGSVILGLIGSLYILFRTRKLLCYSEDLRENKSINILYIFMLMLLMVLAVISLFFSNNLISSLNGLFIYINALLYYFVFWSMRDKKDKILKYSLYTVVLSGVFFSIYQGIILNERIDGNIGYANTYALLLLISLYINEIIETKYFHKSIQILLMLAIFFTGSRTTFILMTIYIVLNFVIRDGSQILSFFISIIIYAAIKYGGIGVILFVPIILYLYEKVSCKIKGKIIYGISFVLGVFSIVLFINTNNEFFSRIRSISVDNPVLQERFVFFQDAAAKILKYPLGTGINSFEYSQYIHQSAFYDVKYIHNSVLQIGYDMGILAAIIFICCFISGLFLIIKGMKKGKKKLYYTALYITIFAHSMLDFDFSYGSTFIIVIMVIVFSGSKEKDKRNTEKIHNKKERNQKVKSASENLYNSKVLKKRNLIIIRLISSATLILTIYLIIANMSMLIGDKYASKGNYKKAEVLYNFNKNITHNNPNIYLRLAQIHNGNYKNIDVDEKAELKECIDYLKAALKINPDDPRIYGNLAFINQKLGNEKETVKYYREFLKREKFYSEIYKLYYEYLSRQLENIKKSETIEKQRFSAEFYEEEIKNVQELYKNNYKKLNPRARYMKDQMSEDFLNNVRLLN